MVPEKAPDFSVVRAPRREMARSPHYSHTLVIRYSECDQQGVVFNAHYQAMCDCVMDLWLRDRMGLAWVNDVVTNGGGFSMVVASEFKYISPAKFLDDLTISGEVLRWGTTSFEVGYVGEVHSRRCFEGKLTYVAVDPEAKPTPVPAEFRERMTAKRSRL